jgi:hypothetical protein
MMDSEMKFREFFGVSRDVLVCNFLNIKTIQRVENYSILNKRRRNGRNYELTVKFENRRDAFPSVNLGNLILVRLFAWVVYVHSILIFHQIPAYSTVYKKYKRREQTPTLPACYDKISAYSRRSQDSDAAAARRSVPVRHS